MNFRGLFNKLRKSKSNNIARADSILMFALINPPIRGVSFKFRGLTEISTSENVNPSFITHQGNEVL